MDKRRVVRVSSVRAASAGQVADRLGLGHRAVQAAMRRAGLGDRGYREPLSYDELRRLLLFVLVRLGERSSRGSANKQASDGGHTPQRNRP